MLSFWDLVSQPNILAPNPVNHYPEKETILTLSFAGTLSTCGAAQGGGKGFP